MATPTSVDQPDDAELWVQARSGDNDAWAALVRRHNPWMWNVCRSVGLDHDATLDVMQKIWENLRKNVDSIRQPAALRGWLKTATKREAIHVSQDLRKRAPASVDGDDMALLASHGPGPLDMIEADESVREMYVAYRELNPRCQQLLRMRYLEDPPWTQEEMAAAIGNKQGSIGPFIDRCIKALRRLMGVDPTTLQVSE